MRVIFCLILFVSDFPSLDFHSVKFNDYCPNKDEAFLTFVKTFLEEKEMEKGTYLQVIICDSHSKLNAS